MIDDLVDELARLPGNTRVGLDAVGGIAVPAAGTPACRARLKDRDSEPMDLLDHPAPTRSLTDIGIVLATGLIVDAGPLSRSTDTLAPVLSQFDKVGFPGRASGGGKVLERVFSPIA